MAREHKEAKEKAVTDIQALSLRVNRFVITIELLGNRPSESELPLVQCLLRQKSRVLEDSVISDHEFEGSLRCFGFDKDEVQAIAKWAERFGTCQ